MAFHWLHKCYRSFALLVTVLATLALAAPALACSTGSALTIEQVGASTRFIVVADVLGALNEGLDYRVRVVEVVSGDAEVGHELTIGPLSATSQVSYPDCWLSLPAGKRVVIALTSRQNLDALTSYAWWEEGGHVVSASPVESWPDTVQGLVSRLRASTGLPSSDTADGIRPLGAPSLGFLALLTAAAAAGGLSWRRMRKPQTPPPSSRSHPS